MTRCIKALLKRFIKTNQISKGEETPVSMTRVVEPPEAGVTFGSTTVSVQQKVTSAAYQLSAVAWCGNGGKVRDGIAPRVVLRYIRL